MKLLFSLVLTFLFFGQISEPTNTALMLAVIYHSPDLLQTLFPQLLVYFSDGSTMRASDIMCPGVAKGSLMEN